MKTFVRVLLATLLTALVLTTATGGVALADTKTHAEAGVEIWVPDEWKTETAENMLVTMTADETVALMLVVLEAGDLDAALDQLDVELAKVVSDIQVAGEPEKAELNGMPAIGIKGTGKVQDKPVKMMLMLFESPTGKVVMALAMAEADKADAAKPTIVKILESLKPTN